MWQRLHAHRSSYVLHRQEGLAPLYVRKAKNYAVKVYKYHCYVVKEYTGDTSMVSTSSCRLSYGLPPSQHQ